MTGTYKKYFRTRLLLLKVVVALFTLAGVFSSCGSKKNLQHHVLHVNDMYLGQDSTSNDNTVQPDYDSPNQDATRYGVRPTN